MSNPISFAEYQQHALSTAVYPRQYVLMGGETVKPNAPSCVYPVFGLCGEAGEVVQVLNSHLGQTAELNKECGDVLWYVAAICSDLSIQMSDVAGWETFYAFQYNSSLTNSPCLHQLIAELFIAVSIVAEATKKTIRDSNGIVTNERLAVIKAALRRVLVALAAICGQRGIDFGHVAQVNLDKLASRAARGTIQGSGDAR